MEFLPAAHGSAKIEPQPIEVIVDADAASTRVRAEHQEVYIFPFQNGASEETTCISHSHFVRQEATASLNYQKITIEALARSAEAADAKYQTL